MNPKMKLLTEWKLRHDNLERVTSKFDALVGTHDGPLGNAIWEMFDAYSKAVAQLVGDESGWLSWFCHENAMGKKKMEAGYHGKLRPICNLVHLLRVIEEKV